MPQLLVPLPSRRRSLTARCVRQLLAGLVLLGGSLIPAGASAAGAACRLSPSQGAFIQRALAGWRQVSLELLQSSPDPLPWMVLFDASCVWHLQPDLSRLRGTVPAATSVSHSGRPLTAHVRRHRGTIRLPDGRRLPVRPVASTSVQRGGGRSFFVMALPEVWRRHRRYRTLPNLERFLQAVWIHELVHTRQIVAMHDRIKSYVRRHRLSRFKINDDLIQQRFAGVPSFRQAWAVERDLLFRAAAERNDDRRRDLTALALTRARSRQARHYVGNHQRYGELEELFLTLEGVAQLAAYHFVRAQGGPTASPASAVAFVRDNKQFWSQEEGLALFLLVDALVPGWQDRVLGRELASPFALLEEALGSPADPDR